MDCGTFTGVEKVQAQVSSEVQVISSIDECRGTPDYVIEVAGEAAVKEHAKKVLEKELDYWVDLGWNFG